MFSHATDEWETPHAFFEVLHAEFHFGLDVAATATNRKTPRYLGPDRTDAWTDALRVDWRIAAEGTPCFMNPPYSRCRDFMAKAAREAQRGVTVVALVPARTDTKWWHGYVWDARAHTPQPGVSVRFLPGRLKFGGMPSSAPFPSVVVILEPFEGEEWGLQPGR